MRQFAAGLTIFAEAGLTHQRPPFGIPAVTLGNQSIAVTEEAADDTPFGTLLHFRKDSPVIQPRVLLVAPMSGHFATLLRGTVEVMLPEHDVYITDWKNARDIPLSDGSLRTSTSSSTTSSAFSALWGRQPCRCGVPAGGAGARRRRR